MESKKSFLFLLLALVCVVDFVLAKKEVTPDSEVTAAAQEESVPGKLISKFTGRSSFARSLATCAGQFGPVCGDCSTLWTCLGEATPAQTINCSTVYPGRPYCVDNACTSVPHTDGECSTGLTCTAAGYFPNPIDCQQYYFCSGPLGSSRVYQCPDSFVYNPQNNQCKRLLWASDCAQVNCDGKQNQFVAYAGDSSLYAYCMVNNGVKPVMLKCGDPNHEFNERNQRCELVCREEGRLPDKSDCHGYFECYRTQTGYGSFKTSCLAGFSFNATTKVCVAGDCAN